MTSYSDRTLHPELVKLANRLGGIVLDTSYGDLGIPITCPGFVVRNHWVRIFCRGCKVD